MHASEHPMSNRRFSRRAPHKQADYIVRLGLALGKSRHDSRDDGRVHSLGTARSHQQALTLLCRWIQKNRLGDLRGASVASIMHWLEERSAEVGQKTLDRDRQATQFLLRQTSGADVRLPRIKSSFKGGRGLANQPRAYTREQVDLICSRLSDRSALSVRLAYASGLRAHELLTLAPRDQRPPSGHREWSPDRFDGREGTVYTVKGKGGLVREVLIPFQLARELESRRLTQPKVVNDRGIRYTSQYDISAGMYFSRIFTETSKKALRWSTGAHGLRHAYVHDRLIELAELGHTREMRMTLVSQELGHFRPEIVNEYLR